MYGYPAPGEVFEGHLKLAKDVTRQTGYANVGCIPVADDLNALPILTSRIM